MKNITSFNLDLLAPFKKIWCLVSGGIDSTYLYELISQRYPKKTIPVNCWNPYEQSESLRQLQQLPSFLTIKPATKMDYKQILVESFQKIPQAKQARRDKKYHKKIFPCCYFIKHTAFKKDPLFQEENTVVISGIKRGDGTQRRIWLTQLGKGTEPNNQSNGCPTFFHKHNEGQLYCYPFRDYTKSELPSTILKQLRTKYPKLDHSGCRLCPVLVVFQDRIKDKRVAKSVRFWNKLEKKQTTLF